MIVPFALRIKEEAYTKIKIVAEKQNRSINKQIEHILNQFIKDYEKVNGKIEED